jgi:hypothetical protein
MGAACCLGMRTSLRPSFWILLGGTLLFDVLLLIPSPAQVMVRPSEKRLCPVPVADVGHRVRCLTEAEARRLAVSPGVVLPLGPDGERLVGPPQRMSGEQQLALGLRLDPNQASADELTALPDIGPSLAQAIVIERRRAPIRSESDLLRVRGLGPKRVAKLRWYLHLPESQ